MTPTTRLTDKSIAMLKKTDVAPEIIDKLARLKDKEFTFQRYFLHAVKREVGVKTLHMVLISAFEECRAEKSRPNQRAIR
jgi:hypothetical protein